MYIVKFSALVHMAETHSQARASFAIWTRAEYFPIYIPSPIIIELRECYMAKPLEAISEYDWQHTDVVTH